MLDRNGINFLIDLARRHTDEIGFIPRPKLEQYFESGQVLLESENDEPCGFLVFGSGWPRLKIYQACVAYDAQRRQHGLALVGKLIARAASAGYDAISLWCADDLAANEFWRAAGFQKTRTKQGGSRRGRRLNLWIFWLPSPLQQRLIVEV